MTWVTDSENSMSEKFSRLLVNANCLQNQRLWASQDSDEQEKMSQRLSGQQKQTIHTMETKHCIGQTIQQAQSSKEKHHLGKIKIFSESFVT